VQEQSGNEVCFFITDPILVCKYLILDSKNVTSLHLWSHKYGTTWSLLIPKKTAGPDPMACDPGSQAVISDPILVIPDPTRLIPDPTRLIPDPTYLITTLC